MYTALDLSMYITQKCIDEKQPITNLQLQKILYYIQRDFLQKKGKRAFPDDIEAWKFGPVVPKVYYRFCGYGAMPISIRNQCTPPAQDDIPTVDSIVEEKRQLSPWKMVAETHKPEGAWDKTYHFGTGKHKIIEPDLIKEYG